MRHALIAARQARRWTQGELAQQIGLHLATVSRYERGDVTPPHRTLEAIAKILRVSISLEALGDNTLETPRAPRDPPRKTPPTPPTRQIIRRRLPSESRLILLAMGRLRQRAHGLQITDADLLTCRSMRDVQRLAKQHYRRLIMQAHPDHQAHTRKGTIDHDNSPQFRRLDRTYDWIMAQPPTRLLRGWMLRASPTEVLEHDVEETGVYGWHYEYH